MWKWLGLIVGLILTGCATAPPRSTNEFEALANRLQAEADFNGNVLVAEQGRIVYQRSIGLADAESRTPLNDKSLFLLGSISKAMTAVAVMQLVERRAISLDDEIKKYLPESRYAGLTVRHLLSHSSGLPEYQTPAIIEKIKDKGVNNATLWRIYADLNLPAEFAPGKRWSYSNTNYILLALIIERVSKQSYAHFLRSAVLAPAGMTDTYVLRISVPEVARSRIAEGHYSPDFLTPDPIRVTTSVQARSTFATIGKLLGPGNIYSTTGDLLKFHSALMANKLLRPETQALMYQPLELTGKEDYSAVSNSNYPAKYGMGWFLANDNSDGRIAFHAGGNPGYSALYYRNLDKDQCVVMLSNHDNMKHFTGSSLMCLLNHRAFLLDVRSVAKAVGKTYVQAGVQAALKHFDELIGADGYSLREPEMSDLGLQILYKKNDPAAAIALLTRNVEHFPKEWNAWDSLAEAYAQAGNNAEAIRYYEKSLQLNPNNVGGRKKLEELKRLKTPE